MTSGKTLPTSILLIALELMIITKALPETQFAFAYTNWFAYLILTLAILNFIGLVIITIWERKM